MSIEEERSVELCSDVMADVFDSVASNEFKPLLDEFTKAFNQRVWDSVSRSIVSELERKARTRMHERVAGLEARIASLSAENERLRKG
jgi:hypothetical protein